MQTQLLKESLVTGANVLSIKNAQNGYKNIWMNGVENFLRLSAFSDCSNIYKSPEKLVPAAAGTASIALDDILMQKGIFNQHQITKALGAFYMSGKIFANKGLSHCLGDTYMKIDNKKLGETIFKIFLGGVVLLGASYFFGSKDIIKTMRDNTMNSVKFFDGISDITDGKINPYSTAFKGVAAHAFFAGGRTFLKPLSVDFFELGGPLNGIIECAVEVAVGDSIANSTKKILDTKFSNLINDDEKIDKLLSNLHTKKILAEYDTLASQVSSGAFKSAISLNSNNTWQLIFAAKACDVGMGMFIASNLFNTFTDIESAHKKNLDNVKAKEAKQEKLHELCNKSNDAFKDELRSFTPEICISSGKVKQFLNLTKKIMEVSVTVIGNAFLTTLFSENIDNDGTVWGNDSNFTKQMGGYYMGVGAVQAAGQIPLSTDGAVALEKLQILFDDCDDVTESDAQCINSLSGFDMTPMTPFTLIHTS